MAQQQQQGGGADNSLSPMWMAAGVIIVVLLIWHFFKPEIVHFIFLIKVYEIDFLAKFTPHFDDLKAHLEMANDAQITPEILFTICAYVGTYMRYPIALILLGLGAFLLLRSFNFRFRSTYSMQKLINDEKAIWPQITPSTTANIHDTDLNEGPWAMSQTPMGFVLRNELVEEEKKPITEGMLTKHAALPILKMNKGKAKQHFALQLGEQWRSIEHLTPPAQALFAVFIAKANGDDKRARQLLDKIATSTEQGKLNFSGVKSLLNRYRETEIVKDALEKHAYEYTVLATLLEMARLDGVLATADFLWLKPIDRALWYVLNNVGRQTAFPEVAGVMAHWISEKELGKPLIVPMVEEAVIGLQAAIDEIIYVPDRQY